MTSLQCSSIVQRARNSPAVPPPTSVSHRRGFHFYRRSSRCRSCVGPCAYHPLELEPTRLEPTARLTLEGPRGAAEDACVLPATPAASVPLRMVMLTPPDRRSTLRGALPRELARPQPRGGCGSAGTGTSGEEDARARLGRPQRRARYRAGVLHVPSLASWLRGAAAPHSHGAAVPQSGALLAQPPPPAIVMFSYVLLTGDINFFFCNF